MGAHLVGALLVGASPLPHSPSSYILFSQNKPVVQGMALVVSVHVARPNKNIVQPPLLCQAMLSYGFGLLS